MNPTQSSRKAKGRRNIRKNVTKKLKKVMEERGNNVAAITKDDILEKLKRICRSREGVSLPFPNRNERVPHEKVAVVRPLPMVVDPEPEEADPPVDLQAPPMGEPQIEPIAEPEAPTVEDPPVVPGQLLEAV